MAKRQLKPHIQVGFVCTSKHFTPDVITAIMGREPSRSFAKGELTPPPKKASKARLAREYQHPWNLWALELTGKQVQVLLKHLIETLELNKAALQRLHTLRDIELSIAIWWDPGTAYGGFHILSDSVAQLGQLAQWLQVYIPGIGGQYEKEKVRQTPKVTALNQALGVDLDFQKWGWLTEAARYDLGLDQRQQAEVSPTGHLTRGATGAVFGFLLDYLPAAPVQPISEEPIARMSLVIRGEAVQPTEISARLAVAPSRSFAKGDPASQSDPAIMRPWGLWALECSGSDLQVVATALLTVLAGKQQVLKEIGALPEHDISVAIWWETPNAVGGFTLPTSLIAAFTAFCTTIQVYLPGGRFYQLEPDQ